MNIHELRRLTVGNDEFGHMYQSEIEELIGDTSLRGTDDIHADCIIAEDGQQMIAYDHVRKVYFNNRLVRYLGCEGDDPRRTENENAIISLSRDCVDEVVVPARQVSARVFRQVFRFKNELSRDSMTILLQNGSETVRYWKFACVLRPVAGSEDEVYTYEDYVEPGYHFAGRFHNIVVADSTDTASIDPDYEEVRDQLHEIQSYHWGHSFPIFSKVMYAQGEEADNQPTYGVELETNNSRLEEQINSVNVDDAWWHMEHDGSITGFECISRPMTYKAWKEKYPAVVNMFRNMVSHDIRSHDAGENYGLHVHIGRKSFRNDEALYNFIGLMHAFRSPLEKLARREDNSYARWFDTGNDMWTKVKAKIKEHVTTLRNNMDPTSRYYCINLKNKYTVEVRIFRGTLNASTFMTVLEILDKIVCCANEMSENDTGTISWSRFVGGQFELGTRTGNAAHPLDLDRYTDELNLEEFFANPALLEYRRKKLEVFDMIAELNASPFAVSEGMIILGGEQ